MQIKYYKIDKEFLRIKKSFLNKVYNLGKSGNFILGRNVENFEKKICNILKVKYTIGVANGTDALELALKAINIKAKDEVITTSNTFISTANAILNVGAIPIFVDVDKNFNINPDLIEKKITKRTKAIIPVHLNGMPCCMKKIIKISKKYKLKIIEDSAQAILSSYNKKYVGTIGDIGCFSLHPTKNLGVVGDGGFITTNNKKIFEKILLLRNHGLNNHQINLLSGRNSRLDEIQSIFALEKIKFLKKDITKRQEIAQKYNKYLKSYLTIPSTDCCGAVVHTYHRYVVLSEYRNKLFKFLRKKGIDVKIHYKLNIHDQPYYKKILINFQKKSLKNTDTLSKKMISLPCNHFMTNNEVNFVIKNIKDFYTSIK
jgi:dTDP-4-amino-4,6-dideoxygalactose transaminase